MRFISLLALLSVGFSFNINSSYIKLLNSGSNFTPIKDSDVYFHISYIRPFNNQITYGAQWWPSNNLYMIGSYSNMKINNDKSLYHSMSLGYSNKSWNLFFFNYNVIEMGVNRIRFYESKIHRWFYLGLKTRTNVENFILGFDVTRFFYDKWARSRFSINFSRKLSDKVHIYTNLINDDFNSFTPVIGFSLGL